MFTFDFSGPHPQCVHTAQYLLVCVWRLGEMRSLWAFRVETRQSEAVFPCMSAICF